MMIEMATVSIVPEKCDSWYFLTWIQHFQCCAKKLNELPIFLYGLAAAYYFMFDDDSKVTSTDLVKHLTSFVPF